MQPCLRETQHEETFPGSVTGSVVGIGGQMTKAKKKKYFCWSKGFFFFDNYVYPPLHLRTEHYLHNLLSAKYKITDHTHGKWLFSFPMRNLCLSKYAYLDFGLALPFYFLPFFPRLLDRVLGLWNFLNKTFAHETSP